MCDLERPRDVSRDMFGVDISGTSPARFRLALPVARFEPFERAMGEGGHILWRGGDLALSRGDLGPGFPAEELDGGRP